MRPNNGHTTLTKMANSHRFMLSSNRFMAVAVGLIVLSSFWFQGSLDTPPETLLSNFLSNFQEQQRGLEIDEFAGRSAEQRNPVRMDEFWLTESEQAYLPFDIEYTPPDEHWGKLQREWSCSDPKAEKGHAKKIIFIHVVRTLGDVIHDFLVSYASSCKAGIANPVMCSGLSWESMISGSWSNRPSVNGGKASKCVLKSGTSRSGNTIDKKYIQNDWFEEKLDILSGQVPIGCHEQWKNKTNDIVEAKYIVSLRDPYHWFISAMIEKMEEEKPNTDAIVKAIREKVDKDLSAGVYHEIYSRYLISPSQISWIVKEQADVSPEHRAGLALRNLVETNAIIAITEDMEGSLEKIQYVLGADKSDISKKEITAKKEQDDKISKVTAKVLDRLIEDKRLFESFQEYMSFEKQIYDEAMGMHQQQLKRLRKKQSSAEKK